MVAQNIDLIPLENLRIDLFNPRHLQQPSQRDALYAIAHDQGVKLVNLADDIIAQGLNPSDLPIVTLTEQDHVDGEVDENPLTEGRADDDGSEVYTVLEGNRRIASLKLLSSPKLLASLGLPASLEARWKELQKRAGQSLPTAINCAVLSREDANHWIRLKHTGENGGTGIVPWDGIASQRFRGSSPALQALKMVAESNYLDDEARKNLAKISITNVERVLGTPEARKLLGVDVKSNLLIIESPNEDEAIARLAVLVSEIAKKQVKVTDLDSKDQRVKYAQKIASMPLPTPNTGPENAGNNESTNNSGASVGGGNAGTTAPASSGTKTPRRVSAYRKTLISRDLKLSIKQTRINQIYHELQTMNVEDFRNSCAVMLRVFIEQSVDHYAQQQGISFKIPATPKAPHPPDKEINLEAKIRAVTTHLEATKRCDKSQLQGIRTLISQVNHILALETLHAYVHNKDYNPSASELKTNWDSIQSFVVALWNA